MNPDEAQYSDTLMQFFINFELFYSLLHTRKEKKM